MTSPEEQFEKTCTVIFPTAGDAAAALAQEVKTLIETKNAAGKPAVLGLATGSTPVPFYRELIRLHREEGLSFRNVITFNLDEYYGLTREHRESYFRFMQEQLFGHIDLPAENIHLPDGTVPLDGQIVEGSINGARFIAFLATLLDKSLKFRNGLTQWLEKVRACFRHPAMLYAVS